MDQAKILSDIGSASDLGALEALRVATLGKSGSVTAMLKSLGSMSAEERRQVSERMRKYWEDRRRAPVA